MSRRSRLRRPVATLFFLLDFFLSFFFDFLSFFLSFFFDMFTPRCLADRKVDARDLARADVGDGGWRRGYATGGRTRRTGRQDEGCGVLGDGHR